MVRHFFCNKVFLPVLALVFSYGQTADVHAQTIDEALQEFVSLVNNVINQTVNAATLFTSQESVSSGYFKFKTDEPGQNDVNLDVLRLPGRIYLKEDGDTRPFIRGQLGILKVTERIAPEEIEGLNDFSTIQTYTGELGAGTDFYILDGFVVTPEASAAYSRIENNYDFNNFESQLVQPLIDKEVFNWDLDVMTYSPKIKVAYTLPLESVRVTFASRYSYLYNNSFSSSSHIIDIESETMLFQNGVDATIPLGVSLLNNSLSLRPFFARTDPHGAARVALGFDHFYEVGMDMAFGTKETIGLLSELSIGSSYTFGDDFEGVRVGVGYKF